MFRGLIAKAIPLGWGQFFLKIGFHRKIGLPAGNNAWAGEIPSLLLTVGKGNLSPQPGTSHL